MGFFGNFWKAAAEQLAEQGVIEEAAETAYETALDMCGNDGQVSVIEMTGVDAFYDAAEAAVDTDSRVPYDIIVAACPYPEAVTIILQDATAVLLDIINAAADALNFGGGDDDEGEEEGDDGFFDF